MPVTVVLHIVLYKTSIKESNTVPYTCTMYKQRRLHTGSCWVELTVIYYKESCLFMDTSQKQMVSAFDLHPFSLTV